MPSSNIEQEGIIIVDPDEESKSNFNIKNIRESLANTYIRESYNSKADYMYNPFSGEQSKKTMTYLNSSNGEQSGE